LCRFGLFAHLVRKHEKKWENTKGKKREEEERRWWA